MPNQKQHLPILNLIAQLRLTQRGLSHTTASFSPNHLLVVTDTSPDLYQRTLVLPGRLQSDDSILVSLPKDYQHIIPVIGVDANIATAWMGRPIEGVLGRHDLVMPIVEDKGMQLISPPPKVTKSKYREELIKFGVLEMEEPDWVGEVTWWTGVEFAKGRSINELARKSNVTASAIQGRVKQLLHHLKKEQELVEELGVGPTPEEVAALVDQGMDQL